MNAALLVLSLVTAASAGSGEASFGSVSPAAMPAGSLAVYGVAGYPELRAGFRQGLGAVELGGEIDVDYLGLKTSALGGLRTPIWEQGPLRLALEGRLGGYLDAGLFDSDYYRPRSSGMLFEVAAYASRATEWPVAFLGFVRLPFQVPLSEVGATRFRGLLGGGAEVAVGFDYYVTVLGAFGPEVRKRELHSQTRLAAEVSIAVGRRLF